MQAERFFNYKGRFAAELSNGKVIMNNGSMHLMVCEKVEGGYQINKADIVAGKMMRTEEDFKHCVSWLNEDDVKTWKD